MGLWSSTTEEIAANGPAGALGPPWKGEECRISPESAWGLLQLKDACACVCVCTYTHTYTYMYVHIDMYVYICRQVQLCVGICEYMCIDIYT